MQVYDTKLKLTGEKKLAIEKLLIIPLIEKHFKPFSGNRASIKSGGRSAKFQQVVEAFRADCDGKTTARVIVDDSHYSVWIKLDIQVMNEKRDHAAYFNDSIYIGSLDNFAVGGNPTGIFTYEFKPEESSDYANKIIAVELADIEQAASEIKQRKAEIESIAESIPYALRELVNPKR